MEALAENWFFVLILLACIGVHFIGHGHGHGHSNGSTNEPKEPDGLHADSESF